MTLFNSKKSLHSLQTGNRSASKLKAVDWRKVTFFLIAIFISILK